MGHTRTRNGRPQHQIGVAVMSGGITVGTVGLGHLSRASGEDESGKPAFRAGDEAPLSEVHNASLSAVWIDRDLSWLEFNRRVLAEAVDERTPLLEQAK